MQQISFKNFRKFQDIDPIDFAPITILVGENNAGKSTVVKAILSILDFIDTKYEFKGRDSQKDLLKQYFYFNKSYFAHIGTFKRALCNFSEDSIIEMSLTASNIKFTIKISGDSDDEEAIRGDIVYMRIELQERGIVLNYYFTEDKLHVVLKNPDINIKSRHNEKVTSFENIPQNASFDTTITSKELILGGNLIDVLISRYCAAIEEIIENKNQEYVKTNYNINEDTILFIKNNKNALSLDIGSSYFPMFLLTSFIVNVDYIYAHAVTQTIIYSAKDTNDYFVKTIHEFASLRVDDNIRAKKFIHKWMQEFKIGENYKIESVGGEAHVVKINSMDGTSVNLADKGMGSIRLMILLFRLATKIQQSSSTISNRVNSNITIIIEEPEQNLHPTLQSKLADLFFELYNNYGFKFLIETHSEYLIRKTQLIVKEKYNTDDKLKNCPFKVYYFPSDGNPYSMIYKKSGIFDNNFGTGFFDEASNLAFELF